MQVIMKFTLATTGGLLKKDNEYDLPPEQALRLIAQGNAIEAKKTAKKMAAPENKKVKPSKNKSA